MINIPSKLNGQNNRNSNVRASTTINTSELSMPFRAPSPEYENSRMSPQIGNRPLEDKKTLTFKELQ